VTVLLFLAVTVGSAVLALFLRPLRSVSLAVGLVGLGAALAAAGGLGEGVGLVVGDVALAGTAYARLVLILAGGSALITFVLASIDDEPPTHAPAALAVMGAVGAALLVDAPIVGLLLVLASGIAGALVVQSFEAPSVVAVAATARSLRAVVVAGGMTVVAAAWLARPLGALALEPAVFGATYLAMVGAVALRAGIVPFHLWLARLADTAPPAALPIFAVWIPVVLTVVTLGWVDRAIAPVLVALETERAAVVVLAVASLTLGSLAGLLTDDLVHLAVYVTVAEAGLALLGLTVFEPDIWQPFRSWLLTFAVAQTALFGWIVAAKALTGSRRVVDLGGLRAARRVLGLALGLGILAGVGLPGWSIWEARARVVELALGPGLAPAGHMAALLPFLAWLRLALVGLRSGAFGRGDGGVGGFGAARRFDGLRRLAARRDAALRGPSPLRGFGAALRSVRGRRSMEAAWRRNRAGVAAGCAVALGLLAVAASAGWVGIDEAAAGGPPSLEEVEPIGGGLEGSP
jgi:NADH-quinone oxidoreductase subunit N